MRLAFVLIRSKQLLQDLALNVDLRDIDILKDQLSATKSKLLPVLIKSQKLWTTIFFGE